MTGSDFSNTTITVGALLLIAGAILGIIRTIDWLNQKIENAVQPVSIKMAASELRAEHLSEKLKNFEVSVVSNFVSNAAVMHLENRMDQGFKAMEAKVASLQDVIVKQLVDAQRDRDR
ncbi:MAG: hypothetical protein JWM36_4320 [Hyphomicrobiales bacterium]|nr:hypothetical protein [Hyphomicrobiales bacterium]